MVCGHHQQPQRQTTQHTVEFPGEGTGSGNIHWCGWCDAKPNHLNKRVQQLTSKDTLTLTIAGAEEKWYTCGGNDSAYCLSFLTLSQQASNCRSATPLFNSSCRSFTSLYNFFLQILLAGVLSCWHRVVTKGLYLHCSWKRNCWNHWTSLPLLRVRQNSEWNNRTPYKGKRRVRLAILTTAWQMVKEEGWQSLSIRRIAEAIEYSAPVIYDHFENKEAILAEFVNEGFRYCQKNQAGKGKAHRSAKTAQGNSRCLLGFGLKQKEYYQLMYGVGMACCVGESQADDKTSFVNLIMILLSRRCEK